MSQQGTSIWFSLNFNVAEFPGVLDFLFFHMVMTQGQFSVMCLGVKHCFGMRSYHSPARNHSFGGLLILLQPQGWLIVHSRLQDSWFWKAHESNRYVEYAANITLCRYLCRWGMVGPRNGSSGMNTKQTDVIPRDHWAATSLYTDQWGRANSSWRWLGFCLGDWSCHNVLIPIALATEVEQTFDDLHASIVRRKETAV